MKTKEFIKILQDADPSGEAHIRMSGGIPSHAVLKEGYWDGPYSYIDEDSNYVYTTQGMKVDIHCTEIDDFVEEHVNIHNPNNWEEIRDKFKFDLTYAIKEQRDERSGRVLDNAREAFDMITGIRKTMLSESEVRAINNAKKGVRFFQNKLVDDETLRPNLHHYYTWEIIDTNNKRIGSNPYHVEGVSKTGNFERLDNNVKEGYYEWVLKE